MNNYAKHLGRRKFLKKGITGGIMIAAFPVWKSFDSSVPRPKSISPGRIHSPNESYRKLLKIVQKHGGEFGGIKGGL